MQTPKILVFVWPVPNHRRKEEWKGGSEKRKGGREGGRKIRREEGGEGEKEENRKGRRKHFICKTILILQMGEKNNHVQRNVNTCADPQQETAVFQLQMTSNFPL